jgi:glycosyltransferase involved in cell wall biosynthesis
LPWQDREDAVLVFGRISPEKRIEACIQIVELARADGFAGKLVIAGPEGPADYTAQIRELAETRDWITVMPNQSGNQRDVLLGKVRYGLNACLYEAFGISSAEMAAAGIIVLVPQGTGQDEIVSDPIQQYASELDASSKLVMLGSNAALQIRLHERAHLVRGRYNPAGFVAAVQRVAQKAISFKTEGRATPENPTGP